MSNSALTNINIGAYNHPFSGVGVEYYQLGGKFDHTGLLIHEIGYIPQSKNWNFPSVFSPFWRLCYNSKPGHCIAFGENFYELTPEHIMLIPDHLFFHCFGKNPVPTFWITFSNERSLETNLQKPTLIRPTDAELMLIKDASKLIAGNQTLQPTDEIYRYGLAILNIAISKPEIKWKTQPPRQLKQVLRYIDKNYAKNLSNQLLADLVFMSIEGLSKNFRTHLGISPAAYVTQIRIKQASHMLLNSSLTIDQIAVATGFPNRNYFSRVFKKITNESPAEFQKQHRKKLV